MNIGTTLTDMTNGRGMCPSKRDYAEWCAQVDKMLPPLKAVAETDAVAPTDMVLVPREVLELFSAERHIGTGSAVDRIPDDVTAERFIRYGDFRAVSRLLSSSPSMSGSEKT